MEQDCSLEKQRARAREPSKWPTWPWRSSKGDIQVQTRLMPSLSGTMNNLVDAVNQIASLRSQLMELKSAIGMDDSSSSIQSAADQLNDKLIVIEGELMAATQQHLKLLLERRRRISTAYLRQRNVPN